MLELRTFIGDAELHGSSKPEELTANDLIAEMRNGPSNALKEGLDNAEEPIVVV